MIIAVHKLNFRWYQIRLRGTLHVRTHFLVRMNIFAGECSRRFNNKISKSGTEEARMEEKIVMEERKKNSQKNKDEAQKWTWIGMDLTISWIIEIDFRKCFGCSYFNNNSGKAFNCSSFPRNHLYLHMLYSIKMFCQLFFYGKIDPFMDTVSE